MSYLNGEIPRCCMGCFKEEKGRWKLREDVWCGDSCAHFDRLMYDGVEDLSELLNAQEPLWHSEENEDW